MNRRQQGFVLPEWAPMAAAAIGVILALAGLTWAGHSFYAKVAADNYARGKSEAEAVAAKAQAQSVTMYEAALTAANARERALELKGGQDQAVVVAQLNKDHANAIAQKDRDITDLKSRTIVLRDPGAGATACPAGGAQTGAVAADPGGAQTGGQELSEPASEFLLTEANRADDLVGKYNSALDLLRIDRETCNH